MIFFQTNMKRIRKLTHYLSPLPELNLLFTCHNVHASRCNFAIVPQSWRMENSYIHIRKKPQQKHRVPNEKEVALCGCFMCNITPCGMHLWLTSRNTRRYFFVLMDPYFCPCFSRGYYSLNLVRFDHASLSFPKPLSSNIRPFNRSWPSVRFPQFISWWLLVCRVLPIWGLLCLPSYPCSQKFSLILKRERGGGGMSGNLGRYSDAEQELKRSQAKIE